MYKTIEVLIPTINADISDAIKLLEYWNVQSDCIISNQCDCNDCSEFLFKNHRVKWIDINSRGVSKNRNNLLNNLQADLGIFIDDDCSLIDGYPEIILDEMNSFNSDAALFTGFNDEGNIINSSKKTIVCKKYSDISHMGGPGICVGREFISNSQIRFNEKLGTPNRIYLGEDSFFGFQLIQTKKIIINSNKPIFKILEDLDNSSYFKGFNEQYFFSKGAINKLVHPKSFFLWRLYYLFKLSKKTGHKYRFMNKEMKKGEKSIIDGKVKE